MEMDIFNAHSDEREKRLVLEAKILDFYSRNRNADDYDIGPIIMEDFKKTFGITSAYEGKIE